MVYYKIQYEEQLETAVQLKNTVNYNPECIQDFFDGEIQISIDSKYNGIQKYLDQDEWCREASETSLLPGCQMNFRNICPIQTIIDLLPKIPTETDQISQSSEMETVPEVGINPERYKLLQKIHSARIEIDDENNQKFMTNNDKEDAVTIDKSESKTISQSFLMDQEPQSEKAGQLEDLEEQSAQKSVLKILKNYGLYENRTAVLIPSSITPVLTSTPSESTNALENENYKLETQNSQELSNDNLNPSDSQSNVRQWGVFIYTSLLFTAGLFGLVILLRSRSSNAISEDESDDCKVQGDTSV